MLRFELVSPERRLAELDAEAVTIPGVEGDLTAMPNHAPFLTTLRPGLLTVRAADGEKRFYVTGGFAEIAGQAVSVLAEEAIEAEAASLGWLEAKTGEAEAALEAAAEDARIEAAQRLRDFQGLKGLIQS